MPGATWCGREELKQSVGASAYSATEVASVWGTLATGTLTIPAFQPAERPTHGSSLLHLEPGPLPTQEAALTTGPGQQLLRCPAAPGVGLCQSPPPSMHRRGHFNFPVHSNVAALAPHPCHLASHPQPLGLPLSLGSITQPPLFPCRSKGLHCTPRAPLLSLPRFMPATHLSRVSSMNEPFPSYQLGICTPAP